MFNEMSLEAVLYPATYRKTGVRKMSEVSSPRLFPLMHFEMPLESVYHHLDIDDVSIGPTKSHSMIKEYGGRMLIEHISGLIDPIGTPRPVRGKTETMLLSEFKRKQRAFRPLNNYERSMRDRNTLIIFNYSFLHQMSFYPASRYAGYYKQHNVYKTFFNVLNEKLKVGDRQHFMHMELPQRIPSRKLLNKTSKDIKSLDGNLIQAFSKPKLHMLQVLWNWLGSNREKSVMSQLDSANLDRLNIVLSDNGNYCILNLGVLLEITGNTPEEDDEEGSSNLQRRFFLMLQNIISQRTEATAPTDDEASLQEDEIVTKKEEPKEQPSKTTSSKNDVDDEYDLDDLDNYDDDEDKPVNNKQKDEDEDDSIVTMSDDELDELDDIVDDDDVELLLEDEEDLSIDDEVRGGDFKEPNDVLVKKIEALANSGRITVGEYKRYLKMAEKNKNLPNPFGVGKLNDYKVISKKDITISNEESRLPATKGVIQDSMLSSKADIMDKKYITTVLNKDISNMVLETQRAGVALTDFKIEDHRDVSNDYRVFTMKLAPIDGEVSTIRQRIPNVQPDGSFMSNGVKYTMKKQRGDLPIRKISSGVVALTTYYAKVFVERSERSVVNYPKWLLNQINVIGLDDNDDRVKDQRNLVVFEHEAKTPRIYSILAQRFREFKVKNLYSFSFDYSKRKKRYGEKEVEEAETGGYVVAGKAGNSLIVCDDTNMFYIYKDKDVKEIGTIEDILELPAGKAPVEIAEFQLFSKSVPVGIALGLHYGLATLMDTLKVVPRRVPTGSKVNLETHEYSVRFADETLVFNRDDKVASLILAGFNRYHREILRYNVDSFNKSEVYMNILESNKIRVGFIRELDLAMDMFVDPISRDILTDMKEPTSLDGLLIRSCELLLIDWHPLENDRAYQRDKGYERVAGALYTEMVRGIRRYRSRGAGALPKVEINPEATWYSINTDASVVQVEESNPIHNLKEKEAVTYAGTGGRSQRSMVKRTRSFNVSDMGLTSEATTDSGTTGINFSLPPDPNLTSLRGIGVSLGKEAAKNPTSMVSTSTLLAPGADHDDQQKTVQMVLYTCTVTVPRNRKVTCELF